MLRTCPQCSYDLTGLVGDYPVCPECGIPAHAQHIDAFWSKRVSARWRWFVMCPLLSLPGLILCLIGQPVIALIGCVICAYRAFELEDRVKGDTPAGPLAYTIQAVLLGTAWAATSSIIIWAACFAAVSVLMP